jgi:ureidoglycolate lyase
MPLDGDMSFFVAPATPAGEQFPTDEVRVFYVPKHTAIVLRPGVWHHAPFAVTPGELNVLVTLPERTYVNDCVVSKIPLNDQLHFEFPRGLID